MAEPALLYAQCAMGAPVPCTVRLHDAVRQIGDVKGTSFEFAELIENTPRAVFLLEEFSPPSAAMVAAGIATIDDLIKRGTVIRLRDIPGWIGRAYEIDNRDPVHHHTITTSLVLIQNLDLPAYPQPPES